MQHVQISLLSGQEEFLDSFIEQQGLFKLVQLLKFSKWQIQAVALDSIPRLYERRSTIEFMRKNSNIFNDLWKKVNDGNKNVRQLALQNFVWLSQVMGTEGHNYIVKGANNYARQQNKSPFTELVYSLNKKWDIDLRYLALQLINCLIVKCPSEKKLSQFLARLENIGLYDELRQLADIKANSKLAIQLQNFQVSTKQVLPSMQFENEVHKSRVKQQASHIEILERKVEHYVEQQSLFTLMKGDLENYKKMYDQSVKYETMYSPFTPQNQFTPEQLIPFEKRNDIIDLTKIMKETKQQYVQLEKTIKDQTSTITELNKQIENLESNAEGKNTQNDRLMAEMQEFQRNAKFAEKSLRAESEKSESARVETQSKLDKAIEDCGI